MRNSDSLSTEPYKGVRDFYPEDMAVQNYIFSVWRKVSEQYGYQEYSASILELSELYRSKGSDEIVNEQMYVFKDKGDREVALRPEMTPTLARMIAARRRSLKFPLRWYSIPNVFRYERPQRGRRREHWQLNCDLMGEINKDPINAEVEIIQLAHEIMTKGFGADEKDFQIKISNRGWLDNIPEIVAVIRTFDEPGKKAEIKSKIITIRDSKLPEEEKSRLLKEIGIPPEALTEKAIAKEAEKLGGLELISRLISKNIHNAVIDPQIMRGFDYYTGIVFEVFDTNPENRRSLFGGGRYDNLLEMFGVEPVPTVGFGMGDVTIRDFLETHKLPPFDK